MKFETIQAAALALEGAQLLGRQSTGSDDR
jgi:hypothetical protein